MKETALFVEREYKGENDIGYIFRELRDVVLDLPPKSTGVTDEYDKVIWSENYKRASERMNKLAELKAMAYALVIRQCPPSVVSKLEGQSGNAEIRRDRDLLGSIKLVQGVCCKFETMTQPFWVPHQAKK